MDQPTKIASLQNPRVKALVKLRRRRARDAARQFIIEETLVIERALAAEHPLETVYCCPELITTARERDLLRRLRTRHEAPPHPAVIEVTAPVMRKIAYRAQPTGLLVVAPQPRRTLADLRVAPDALLVVLENVEKPGNLGAVLRAADGAGASAVLLCGHGADLFNPNVLRASRGTVFQVPTVAAPSAAVADWLASHSIRALAATPQAATLYTDADLRPPVALVLGAEDTGLSDRWLDRADRQVRIPMRGGGDSLNVATTAAILLYEAIRQESARR